MEKSSIKFPSPYRPEEINTVVCEITDHTTYEEKLDKQMPTVLKDQGMADTFMQELNTLCKKHGFMLNRSGPKEQMAARLFKKNSEHLMVETEVLEFAIDMNNQLVVRPNHIPSIKDVKSWIEKRNQRTATINNNNES